MDNSERKPEKKGRGSGLIPFKPGPDPRRGKGPKPGTGGRPRDEFKAFLRELASRPETMAGLDAILSDPGHPQYLRALEFVTERGYGKEPQALEGGIALTVVRRDESSSGGRSS